MYSSQDAFREIENEYNNFSINYKYISLIGDFNGRTADEDDFFFSSENHGYDAARYIENDVLTLDELHIPRKRSSFDAIKNGYGKTVLYFCKGNILFIVNGRIGDDLHIITCSILQFF
jgi:hypothetical protein